MASAAAEAPTDGGHALPVDVPGNRQRAHGLGDETQVGHAVGDDVLEVCLALLWRQGCAGACALDEVGECVASMVRRDHDKAVAGQVGAQKCRLASVTEARVRIQNERKVAGLKVGIADRCLAQRVRSRYWAEHILRGLREIQAEAVRRGRVPQLDGQAATVASGIDEMFGAHADRKGAAAKWIEVHQPRSLTGERAS